MPLSFRLAAFYCAHFIHGEKTGTDHVFFNFMCPVKRTFAVPAKRGLSLFLEVLI